MKTPKDDVNSNTSVPQDAPTESDVSGRGLADPNTSVPQDQPGADTSVPQDNP